MFFLRNKQQFPIVNNRTKGSSSYYIYTLIHVYMCITAMDTQDILSDNILYVYMYVNVHNQSKETTLHAVLGRIHTPHTRD